MQESCIEDHRSSESPRYSLCEMIGESATRFNRVGPNEDDEKEELLGKNDQRSDENFRPHKEGESCGHETENHRFQKEETHSSWRYVPLFSKSIIIIIAAMQLLRLFVIILSVFMVTSVSAHRHQFQRV